MTCLRLYFPVTRLDAKDEKQLLLDLLDAQACVYSEQVWVANEMATKAGARKPFPIGAHFSMAWLQINDNLRIEVGLRPRGARHAMLEIRSPETLAARLVSTTRSASSEAHRTTPDDL